VQRWVLLARPMYPAPERRRRAAVRPHRRSTKPARDYGNTLLNDARRYMNKISARYLLPDDQAGRIYAQYEGLRDRFGAIFQAELVFMDDRWTEAHKREWIVGSQPRLPEWPNRKAILGFTRMLALTVPELIPDQLLVSLQAFDKRCRIDVVGGQAVVSIDAGGLLRRSMNRLIVAVDELA
jgi:hypothetical protein